MSRKGKMDADQIKEFLQDREEGGQTLDWCAKKFGLSIGRMSQIQKQHSPAAPKQMELPLVCNEEERRTDPTEV